MKAHSLNPLLLHMFDRTYIVTTWFDSGFFVSAKWDTSGPKPFFVDNLDKRVCINLHDRGLLGRGGEFQSQRAFIFLYPQSSLAE